MIRQTSVLLALLVLSVGCVGTKKARTAPTLQRPVVVGADRLLTEFAALIDGKKVALVANHTSRLADGTHLADAIAAYPRAELVALFGMNFDVRTNDYSLSPDADATVDAPTGARKYSLYGDIHKPAPEMLEGVDVIVFDIQEVGARFYEHVNILGFVMEAAAEHGIPIVVLDRPNPLTGLHMDGFVTDDASTYSFGAYAKVPVLHGMTMGELARLYNGERMLRGGQQADLHVVEMTGWKRAMWFDETGLDWIKPSPNLPTLRSVTAYAGTCLFEGLNLSEGRGTEKPFEYIGAPWLDHEAAADLLNGLGLEGVRFEPVTFTPTRAPFHGRDPYMAGEIVRGLYLNVTDRDRFQPYRAGIAMLWAVQALHGERLEWNEPVMARLTATPRVLDMIRGGHHPQEIFASWADELQAFRRTSERYWLYE